MDYIFCDVTNTHNISVSEELINLVLSSTSIVANQWLIFISIEVYHLVLIIIVAFIVYRYHLVIFTALNIIYKST